MPGAPLDLTIPDVTDTWPTWSSKVEECLRDIEADLEPPVLFSELSANANFDLSNFASTNARYYSCYPGNSTTIPTNGIGVKNGEWYATDGAGNEIQVTSNGTLNFAATGGFTGDYVSAGAQARYTNATTLYEFLDGTGALADGSFDDIRVSNGANYALLQYGGSVNTNFILPPTVAAGVSVLTVDASGNVAHNATIGVGFTINNANVTLTGTADIKHPDHTQTLAGVAHGRTAVINDWTTATSGGRLRRTGSITSELYPQGAMNRVGSRLKSVVISMNKSDGTVTTFTLHKVSNTGAIGAAIGTNTTTALGNSELTVTVGVPSALVAGEHWCLQVVYVGAGDHTIFNVRWLWDRT